MNPFSFSYSGWAAPKEHLKVLSHAQGQLMIYSGSVHLFVTFEQADGLRDALIAARPISVTGDDPQ